MDRNRRMDHNSRECIFVRFIAHTAWVTFAEQYDCAKHLNGRGLGCEPGLSSLLDDVRCTDRTFICRLFIARYDGTYPGSTTVYGDCSPFTGPTSNFPSYYRVSPINNNESGILTMTLLNGLDVYAPILRGANQFLRTREWMDILELEGASIIYVCIVDIRTFDHACPLRFAIWPLIDRVNG
jgi:hypothetical protein